jgi:hypothetical protein
MKTSVENVSYDREAIVILYDRETVNAWRDRKAVDYLPRIVHCSDG